MARKMTNLSLRKRRAEKEKTGSRNKRAPEATEGKAYIPYGPSSHDMVIELSRLGLLDALMVSISVE